ncbi:MAG TPA: IclR family transcriptional regulator [Kineosporiaceae bacterium]
MAGNARRPGVSVASRVLDVLSAFDADNQRLTLTQIARRADLPLATAHRLVAELEGWQGLRRREDGRYVVGRRLWDIGMLSAVQADLREVAVPYLQDVHATTGETVHLAIRDDLFALYVERIVGRNSVQVLSRAGSRLPLHATAVGKVLLAYAGPQVVQAALVSPARVTAYTVTEPGRLHRELTEVGRRGFARTAQEMTPGAWSVAVPVGTASGEVVAALGIVVASPSRDLARLVPVLKVAAHGISRSLPPGWHPG